MVKRNGWKSRIYGAGALALAVLLMLCPPALANTTRTVDLVIGDKYRDYRELTALFEKKLQDELPRYTLHFSSTKAKSYAPDPDQADIIVSFGKKAARKALETRGATPLLCVLIGRAAFQSLVKQRYGSTEAGLQAGVSALYLDQPNERIFQLAKLIVPDASSAGLVTGPVLNKQASTLKSQASHVGLDLHTVALKQDTNPVVTLDPLVRTEDVMLALPDKAGISRQTAKWLLYLSYQRGKPLIGYSGRFTEAGAVASVYSSKDDIAANAAELAAPLLLNNGGPGVVHPPQHFSVSLNKTVARKLDLDLKSAKHYQREILRLEKAQ